MKIIFLSLVLTFSCLPLYPQDSPKLVIEGGETLNIGSYPQGNEVTYDIKFMNAGKTDLKINSVSTSCGCSSALLSNDVIKPGENGSIKFTYNGLVAGIVSKAVYIQTNETDKPSHTVTITVNMVQPLSLNPTSVIGACVIGEEFTQTIVFSNNSEKEVSISEITSNSPAVKVNSDNVNLPSGSASSIIISVKMFEDSPVNATVTVKTSAGDYYVPILVDAKAK